MRIAFKLPTAYIMLPAYLKQHESAHAIQSLKESLKIRSRFGYENLDVMTTLIGMIIVYFDKGDLSKELDCYEAALEIQTWRGKEFEWLRCYSTCVHCLLKDRTTEDH